MEASSTRERANSAFRKVASIPDDIFIEILLRLPVKSLLRFKLICKTWYNLIRSPSFKSMHHNINTSSQLLIYTKDELDNHFFSFRSNDKSTSVLSPDLEIPANYSHMVEVAGCCNGIVCYFYDWSTIYLSNPATREFKRLPPTSIPSGIHLELYQVGVGFGFDSANMYDFKVLRLFGEIGDDGYVTNEPNTFKAEIFTLSSNTWKQLDFGLDDKLRLNECYGLFYANSFHFLCRHYKVHTSIKTIVLFDIRTERFKMTNLPSEDYHKGNFISLLVFKKFLSSLFRAKGFDWIEIWIMKDYGIVESWTKLYRIGPSMGLARVLCFWMDESAVLLVNPHNKKLVSCRFNTHNIESMENIEINGYKLYDRVVVYRETLVSII